MERGKQLRTATAVQQQAIDWSKGKDCPAFFMEMRLGKTMTAIRWAAKSHSVVVIAPIAVITEWQNELLKERINSVNLHSIKKELRLPLLNEYSNQCWFIINPDTVRLNPALLTAGTVDTVILDESVVIKNPRAGLFKAMIKHSESIPRKALLSGLPAPENCMELCCQFLWLMGRFLNHTNYYQARNELTFEIPMTAIRKVKKDAWCRVKNWLSINAFCRTQKEAGFKRDHLTRLIQLNCSKKQLIDTEEVKQLWELRGIETKHILTVSLWLKRLAGGFTMAHNGEWIVCNTAKAEAVLKLIDTKPYLTRTIVWFNYTAEINYINAVLMDAGIDAAMITGKTKPRNRAVLIEQLQAGLLPVLLIQIKCGLYGLNLSAASQAIYYSLPWSCNEFKQSKERIIDRDGAKKTTVILQSKNSIDTRLYNALKGKAFNAIELITGYFRGNK